MSDLHGLALPELPPARPMTEQEWARLHDLVFGTIASHDRKRRRLRVLLVAAVILVLAAVATAAAWQLTRASATATQEVSVACAGASTADPDLAVVEADGSDPRVLCAVEWSAGRMRAGAQDVPPLTACARSEGGTVRVTVFPSAEPGTCAALGFDELPATYAADATRFAALRDALRAAVGDETHCAPYDAVRDAAEAALRRERLDGWEVARDGSVTSGSTCVAFWLVDYAQQAVFLFGGRLTG